MLTEFHQCGYAAVSWLSDSLLSWSHPAGPAKNNCLAVFSPRIISKYKPFFEGIYICIWLGGGGQEIVCYVVNKKEGRARRVSGRVQFLSKPHQRYMAVSGEELHQTSASPQNEKTRQDMKGRTSFTDFISYWKVLSRSILGLCFIKNMSNWEHPKELVSWLDSYIAKS